MAKTKKEIVKNNWSNSIWLKAKRVTILILILLIALGIIGLIIGICCFPDNPNIIVDGIASIASYMFPFFLVVAGGVATTGAGEKIINSWFNGKNGKETYDDEDIIDIESDEK